MRPLVSLHRLVRAVWAALLLTSLAGAPALAQEAPAATAADWLVPSDAVPGARFGADVALIGGGHLVVGAPGAHGERPRTGAAYVFTYDRDRLAWIETAKLTAPDGLSGDEFGARVRPHGTDTLHIEAARARTRYVFVRDASGWRYADQLRNAPEDGDLTVRGGDVTASASFEDLDGRTYQAVLSSDRDSTQLVIPINLVEGEDVTLAASLTDPDLQTADLASAQRFPAFDGRYLALGTPDVDGGGAVYVWTLAGRWVSDDLAPTLPGLQAKAGPEEYAEVEVFYGTDRARTGRRSPRRFYGGRRGGDLEVGTTTVTIPTSHKPGAMESPSWMRLQFRANPAKHIILKDVRPLDTDEAVAAMQAALDSTSSRAVLLYVHGFNVSFEDAARRAAQMAYDLDFDGIPAFYSWPSDASLLSYLSDENDVMWSVFHLKAFLRLLALQSGAEEVHVVAHSMGNRAVTQALREFACEFKAPQFNQVILAAPDVDAEIFARDIAPAISGAAEQITLYTSQDDTALKVSQALHGAPRAGNSLVTAMGVTTVDASGLDPSLLGHSYYADLEQLLLDIGALVKQGLAPAARALLPKSDSVWELK